MKLRKYYTVLIFATLLGSVACKKELDVKNPNEPAVTDAETESGIIALAQGAVYINGWNGINVADQDWLGTGFFSLVYGYQELMADMISATASNQNINVINVPDYVILDDGTRISNTSSQKGLLRIANQRSARSSNAFYYEWGYMYSLNNACNNVLASLPNVTFSGDQAVKSNTIKAWALFWKGYAYSRIGSIYYAGLINDDVFATNSHYVAHDAIIAEANKNLDAAAAILNGITNAADYSAILGQVIADFSQSGHGGILTPQMWLHSINTLKARNLLVNKKAADMTPADWNAVLTLTNNGISSADKVFISNTTTTNDYMAANNGSAASMTTGPTATFSVSERLIQEFKTGDKRLANNFTMRSSPQLNQTGGFTFSTNWYLEDGGNGLPGVIVYSDETPGNYELYITGSYEENALITAEAKIYTGDVEGGLALIDAVRAYQGAGVAPIAGTGLNQQQAIAELRMEKRAALVFRGVSFYDYRRWGYTYDITKGGGRTGAVVLTSSGALNTNATINYNFLDYWDVPADEVDLNAPDAGSAPVINPN